MNSWCMSRWSRSIAKIKPGPNALTVDLPEEEIRRRLGWALDAFEGYVGINNHMGSRFTSERPGHGGGDG